MVTQTRQEPRLCCCLYLSIVSQFEMWPMRLAQEPAAVRGPRLVGAGFVSFDLFDSARRWC
jgi:hypothetical protein